MKGTLHKSELYQGWIVRFSSPKEYKQNIHEYPLHPDDVQQIKDDSQIFDNIEARIATWNQVEFKLEKKYLYDETITYAKLIPDNKVTPENLNPNEWILIKKETLDNLINNFKENDVDTEILVAIFKWLTQHNTLK